MRVTDFNKDLNTSRANTRHSVVARALREAFPRLLATHEAHPRNDRAGVDVWLELPGIQPQGCDLKIRSRDYGKQAGEAVHCVLELTDHDGPGWAVRNSLANWLLFVCLNSGRWARFAHADVVLACLRWRNDFLRHPRCTPMETITKGRDGKPRASMAVAVPADVLQRAIDAAKGEV